MSGFVCLHREAFEHPLLQDPAHFKAWFWLVSKAVWKPTRYDVRGKIITIQRGQLCVSVRQLADDWGWSKSAVDRFLTRLKTETMIGTDSGTGRMVITICNYSKYQDQSEGSGTPTGTPTGTPAGHQRDIKEQGNHITSRKKDTPLPPIRDDNPFAGEAWDGWLDMRKKTKQPATDRALNLAVRELRKLQAQGHDPDEVLNQSTINNWRGLFPLKENRNEQRNQQASQGNLGPTLSAGLDFIGGH